MTKLDQRLNRSPGKPRRSPSRGAVPRIVSLAQRLGRKIPASERAAIPADFSDQIDHYVYGTPKR